MQENLSSPATGIAGQVLEQWLKERRAATLASAERIVPALTRAFESSQVKAVLLSIDSPGGAPVEAERIYRAIDVLKAVTTCEIRPPVTFRQWF